MDSARLQDSDCTDSVVSADSSTASPSPAVPKAVAASSRGSRNHRKADETGSAAKASTRREFIEQAAVVGVVGVGLAATGLLASGEGRAEDSGASAGVGAKRPTRREPVRGLADGIDAIDPDTATTLLDEVGRLRRTVPATAVAAWKAAVGKKGGGAGAGKSESDLATLNPRVAAVLHLWLGEYELNAGSDPEAAERHFKAAKALAPSVHDRVHGWSVYNLAVSTVYQGNYGRAAERFHDLLHHEPKLGGFSRKNAALFGRHMNAHAASHDELADLGIPQPQRLDPFCGAAALATCLRGLGLPSDRRSVLKVCKVTGRGSTMEDLLDACGKMPTVTGRIIQADEEAIQHMPLPAVAFVQRDHFVALVKADKKGVSYLCSDCGEWPGGRVDLSWEQWRAMQPGIYLSVVKAGSEADKVLALLCEGKANNDKRIEQAAEEGRAIPGVQVAFNPFVGKSGKRVQLGSVTQLSSLYRQLEGHILMNPPAMLQINCGYSLTALQCAIALTCCLIYKIGGGTIKGFSSSAGDR